MSKKKNSACDKLLRKGGPKRGPAGLSHYGRNYKPTRQAAKKKTKVGQRNIKPIIVRSPASDWSEGPKESPHERPGNTDGESPGHGRHMSSRQTLGQI